MRVLPTLDVLLFAIDVTAVPTIDMIYVKRELDIMLQVFLFRIPKKYSYFFQKRCFSILKVSLRFRLAHRMTFPW